MAALEKIEAPATLIIGEVVQLRNKLKVADRDLQSSGVLA
jgi:siroheme synthase